MRLFKLLGILPLFIWQVSYSQVINIGPKLLPQEEAFEITANLVDDQLYFTVAIADGYYVYRNRLSLNAVNNPSELGELNTPPGIVTTDEFFGEVETYRNLVALSATRINTNDQHDLLTEFVLQGCADVGVCYPPYSSKFVFPANGGTGKLVSNNLAQFTTKSIEPISNTNSLFETLNESSILIIMFVFFNAGLFLSFTPCVLPMIPIALSVTTNNQNGANRSIFLAIVYVLTMAIIYTIIGIITAKTSASFFATTLQSPIFLIPLTIIFFLLGLAMYFDFNIKLLPQTLSNKVLSLQKSTGSFKAASTAGLISAIVVSPCVAAPLVGALLFIASTGDVVIGGLALFSLAIGMGVLPLIFASGAESFLPKAGAVHLVIKKIIAIFLMALGVWILGSLIIVPIKLILYGVFALMITYLLIKLIMQDLSIWWSKTITSIVSLAMLSLASIFLIGGFTNANNELAPLAHLYQDQNQINFIDVANLSEYNDLQKQNFTQDKKFEYYTANWCISCTELEAYTLNDTAIAQHLNQYNYQSIKVDLSEINDDTKKLLAMNNIFGPPAIIVKTSGGQKLLHLTGYVKKEELLNALVEIN